MTQPPHGSTPPPTPQLFPPPRPQHPPVAPGFAQQQWHPNAPMGPGFQVVSRPAPTPGKGWWTTSAVLAFIGAASAVSVLGLIATMVGFLGFFVAVQGGGEAVRQMSDDVVHTTTWLFYVFLAMQFVSIALGLWGGRNCLRGKASGALMTMLLGVLGVGEIVWLGLVAVTTPARMVVGIVAALALVVSPAIALRFPQPCRR